MADVLVTDLETGAEAFIPQEEYDPARHQLAQDQVATVTPVGEDEEFLAGQAVTEESLQRGLYPEAAPEARAAQTREQVQEEFDTLANTLEQAGRGALAGATFGLSELAIGMGDDALEREQQRREREAGGNAFLAGEIAGAIVPGILTGGTSVLASAARLAPSARLASAAAKVAAKGGLRRQLASNAVEGAVGAVGEAIARETIAENPEFSAEAMLGAALQGAGYGAAGGAIGSLIFRGAGTAARRLEARAAAEAEEFAARAAKKADVPGLFKGTGRRTNYKRVVGNQLADTSADRARDLGVRIDDLARARGAGEIDDILARTTDDVAMETGELAARARAAAGRVDEAAEAARGWFARYADDVGLDTAKKRLTKSVSDEVEDAGIDALGDLDRAAREYDELADELAARANVERTSISAPQTEVGRTLTDRLRARVEGITDLAAPAMGAAELAATAGVEGLPTTRDIPVVGGLVSLYLQGKTAARLASKAPGNWFRSSRVTDAAEAVTSARNSVRTRVQAAATGALKRVSRSKLPMLTGTQIAARVGELRSESATGPRLAEALEGLPPETQAGVVNAVRRATDYMLANAPRPPAPGAVQSAPWEPSAVEKHNWALRQRALQDPLTEFEAVVVEPGAPGVGFEAARTVFPALWEQYRAGLAERGQELAENYSPSKLAIVGRAFALPLTVSNLHDYGQPLQAPGAPSAAGPDLRFAAPTQVTTSPMATLEQTDEQRRRA